MKTLPALLLLSLAAANAQSIAPARSVIVKSAPENNLASFDNDPEVVYLQHIFEKPLILSVAQEFPIFSDKNGANRIGFLAKNQQVEIEAITERAYRVRGKGSTGNGIVGWISPQAFTMPSPDFPEKIKKFYQRQILVNRLIAKKQVAIGMLSSEVTQSLGEPTKQESRKTDKGNTSRWEYVLYEEQKNFAMVRDPATGQMFRQLVSVTQVEKEKQVVEFENDAVTAIEHKQDQSNGNVRIVIPPLVFSNGWW